MTVHVTARLAWHADGWNGCVCKAPRANGHCIGLRSYPGQLIAETRDLAFEEANAGTAGASLSAPLPCCYSVNAFGQESIQAQAKPPDFFQDSTKTRMWTVPPATVCAWPYEEMYDEELKKERGYFDNEARLTRARAYFAALESGRSLVFYYANYSNPLSDEAHLRYVVVGVSRLKAVGEELFYEGCSDATRKKFAGGFVWDRNLTSFYPDQGLRIPYHRYLDRPEVLERIALLPDGQRPFKYGTRHVTDDEALELVERLLEVATQLRDLGDDSESWPVRIAWLESVVAELWQSRGVYPGLARTLDALGVPEAVSWVKAEALAGRERAACAAVFSFLDGGPKPAGLKLMAADAGKVQRRWKLLENDTRALASQVLPRFALDAETIKTILGDGRADHGIDVPLAELSANPYLLSERFVGDAPEDRISFETIDHGMLPSPDLGEPALADPDDGRRFRALCVDRLLRDSRNTFVSGLELVGEVNRKLKPVPEWKRHVFADRYFEVDEVLLSKALTSRSEDGARYVYLRERFEDERTVEKVILDLAKRPDIQLRVPLGPERWRDFLYDPKSDLARLAASEYEAALAGQVEACAGIFNRPLAVLSGGAGTGKTTVVRALVNAIERVHGGGTTFCLLAPTGKAADRLRETSGKQASTIHSFLASRGWLNDNLTFKRRGGKRETGVSTVIVDESSMLDLGLAAALLRAFDWNSVQRLIFVGDISQLPPIGVGRVYADLVDWLKKRAEPSLAVLDANVRQLLNRATGQGTGILDVAELYLRYLPGAEADEGRAAMAEDLLRRLQGGGDVDKDLRVVFWQGGADLVKKLREEITGGLIAGNPGAGKSADPSELWLDRVGREAGRRTPDAVQVITPYRGDASGTEILNAELKVFLNGRMHDRVGSLGAVSFQDKIIQICNRPKSDPYWAYNSTNKKSEKLEVFNGEMGFAEPHLYDCSGRAWERPGFRVGRFQAVFSRKREYRIGIESKGEVERNLDLAYAISIHKAQGSDFEHVFFVLPKGRRTLLSTELLYTGLTRARRRCTLLVEDDIEPLLSMRRPEASHLLAIASSLLEFRPIPDALRSRRDWYEEGKIHRSLAEVMVRSKSELVIANLLFEREIDFRYEKALFASDGTFVLPDFTIRWQGEDWYWEHVGMLHDPGYRARWEWKQAWYEQHHPGRLVTTFESGQLSHDADAIIRKHSS